MTTPLPLSFTGERLVPGQVDRGLLEEHVARYQWACARLSEQLASGAAVLDLACGTGYGTHMLATQGFQVLGVDVSPEAVAWASETFHTAGDQAASLQYVVADAGAIPIPDASRQGIVAFEILEHLEDPDGMLREIARLLAPGGIALISTPNPDDHQIAGENEFHHHEYSIAELHDLFARHFAGWQLTLYGQAKEGLEGSSTLTALRKQYIGIKRKLGLGPLLKKGIAPWQPGDDLRQMAHPYHFERERTHGVEYFVAELIRPR